MPLNDDLTPAGVSANIAELVRSGRKRKQAIAIALSHVRELKRRKRKK
jgi:hypothetical protein